jgi:hypothetical protein
MRERLLLLLLLLGAACGSSGSRTRGATAPEVAPGERFHVVYNQYRGPHTIFIVENLAGRDLVELRSRVLAPGETPVAYVEDEVMARMIDEFERFDYYEYARPRPRNPPALGATGELTVTDPNGRRLALLRIKAPQGVAQTPDQVAAAQAYGKCTRTFLAVWEFHRPKMQATTSRGAFGRQP